MIVGTNSLVNAFVPTFLIKNLRDGQGLIYDSVRRAFINSDLGTGTGATRLGELEDVSPTVDNLLSLETGQALVYNSFTSLWANTFIDYNTLLNKPTSTNFSFAGLSDTSKPSVPNGYVLWDSTGTQLVYSTTIPFSSIVNVSPTVDTLNNTTDIGKVLQWNGTQWIPTAINGVTVVANLATRNALTPILGNQAYVIDSNDGTGDYINQWSLWIYTITGPSNGWTLLSREEGVTEGVTLEYMITPLSPTSPSIITVGTLETGGRIVLITVEVKVAFNGPATLQIGYNIPIAGPNPFSLPTSGILMTIPEIDLTIIDVYETVSDILFGTDTPLGDIEITGNFVNGGATVGIAQIIVSYV